MGQLGFTDEQLGHSDKVCGRSIGDIFDVAHERDGLVILAHIDDHKGAYFEAVKTDSATGKVRIPGTCPALFNDLRYDAVEVTKGGLPEDFNPTRGFKRIPAFYQSSDNPDPADPKKHSKDGIGSRFAWFKMDEITREGLRQCFADPAVRIRQMGAWEDGVWPHIVSMRIGNGGFLSNQTFTFHPGLNSIIGGKGAGKSLTIEFLRYALGQPSQDQDIKTDHKGKLENRLGKLNSVEVTVCGPTGVCYKISRRDQGDGTAIVDCVNADTSAAYNGDLQQLFPILAYSQTEVIRIAADEGAQLRLVDSLIDTRDLRRRLDEVKSRLRNNDRQMVEALSAQTKVDKLKEDVATYSEQIKALDAKLNSPLRDEMHAHDRKKVVFGEQLEAVGQLLTLIDRLVDEVGEIASPELADGDKKDAVLVRSQTKLEGTLRSAQTGLATIHGEAEKTRKALEKAQDTWMKKYQDVRHKYEVELQGTNEATLEADRRKLAKAKADAERDLAKALQLAEKKLPTFIGERVKQLDRLEILYRELYEARYSQFQRLTEASSGRLKLEIVHANNRTAYRDTVRAVWKGGALGIPADKRLQIADHVSPRQLVEWIIGRDANALGQAAQISLALAERFINRAWESDEAADILAVQYGCYPEDTPCILYNKGGDKYAPLHELSVGQKCTALLIIALCDGSMPVIIDQPEDALDIASVWSDVAMNLRRGKDGRQFILTTHNSTIAVGADSDSFLILEPQSNERAKVLSQGAIDRAVVRKGVIEHMEGGDDPYRLRQDKYNIK